MKIVVIRSNDLLGETSRQVQHAPSKNWVERMIVWGLHIYNLSAAISTG